MSTTSIPAARPTSTFTPAPRLAAVPGTAGGASSTAIQAPSRAAVRVGSALSVLITFLLTLDAAGKLLELAPVVTGSAQLGYPARTIFPMGAVLLLSVIAYAVPRTSVLGAVLLTGYLGGAIATHLRVGNPLLSHTLFPIYVAAFVWGGLYLREPRLRALLPLRASR